MHITAARTSPATNGAETATATQSVATGKETGTTTAQASSTPTKSSANKPLSGGLLAVIAFVLISGLAA